MTARRIRRALLSVSDKTGLLDLAKTLARWQIELISTGGTRQALSEAGLAVRDISEVTLFPEMLAGRVKTLHPKIHGGILARRDVPEHMQTLAEHKIEVIDLVVCNLYPFAQTLAKPGSTHEEIVENIDIGGPSMVRSAAKNYHDVAVVTDPGQYAQICAELEQGQGSLTFPTREKLATAAFARTAEYDRAISAYFEQRTSSAQQATPPETSAKQSHFPAMLTLSFTKHTDLRYGENPHQQAAFYLERASTPPKPCVANAEVLHGKELSYNNLLDLESAFQLVQEFDEPAAVVIKHNNPCGTAIATTLVEAFRKAHLGDPLSAFGGVLAFNRPLDEATALQITEPNRFIECLIAPGYDEAALQVLTTRPTWKKSVRILRAGPLAPPSARKKTLDYRRVEAGLLVQERDLSGDDFAQHKTATKLAPTADQLRDLRFAWLVCKHVKSNAIVLAKDGMIVGVGAGQMSRVDSTHMALRKAGDRSKGSVLASDAFFPFRDNVDEAARGGVAAIAQPGGSVRDQESIDACNELGLAMIFTGVRHFRH